MEGKEREYFERPKNFLDGFTLSTPLFDPVYIMVRPSIVVPGRRSSSQRALVTA